MPVRVGVRRLRDELSRILERVKGGEIVTVTDRQRPVAMLIPLRWGRRADLLQSLVEAGRLAWSGGKPVGSGRPATVRGRPVAQAVLEDRR